LKDLSERILWLVVGRGPRTVAAFDWIRGGVGSRQNPDGMRSLIHAGLAIAGVCLLIDGLILWRHGWAHWTGFAFGHSAWISAFIVASALNVGFLETVEGERMKGLGGPNALTLTRGLLLPSLIYLLALKDYGLAVAFYVLLSATDIADGWWARHGGLQSKLGVVLDPIVDLLFHLGVLFTLSLTGLLGPWVMGLILARSALLVFGTAVLYFWKGRVRILPTPIGKGTGFLVCLATILLLGLMALDEDAGGLAILRACITLLLTVSLVHVLAMGIINLCRPPAPTRGEDRTGKGGW